MPPDTTSNGPSYDVWSLGVILYEVISGVDRLFQGVSLQDFVNKIQNFKPENLPVKIDEPELDTICCRALEKDTQKRYQSAQELGQALKDYLCCKFREGLQEKYQRKIVWMPLKKEDYPRYRWEADKLEQCWKLGPPVISLHVLSIPTHPLTAFFAFPQPEGEPLGAINLNQILPLVKVILQGLQEARKQKWEPAIPKKENIYITTTMDFSITACDGWPYGKTEAASSADIARLLCRCVPKAFKIYAQLETAKLENETAEDFCDRLELELIVIDLPQMSVEKLGRANMRRMEVYWQSGESVSDRAAEVESIFTKANDAVGIELLVDEDPGKRLLVGTLHRIKDRDGSEHSVCMVEKLVIFPGPPPTEEKEFRHYYDAKTDVTFIHIPAGEFWLGAHLDDKDAYDNEKMPEKPVYLPEYWIARTPVTRKQYEIYWENTNEKEKCELFEECYELCGGDAWLEKSKKLKWLGITGWNFFFIIKGNRDWGEKQYFENRGELIKLLLTGPKWWNREQKGPLAWKNYAEDHPVVGVSWLEAMAYCKWAGYELPGELYWEKAARGGIRLQGDASRKGLNENPRRIYTWGNTWDRDDRINSASFWMPGIITRDDWDKKFGPKKLWKKQTMTTSVEDERFSNAISPYGCKDMLGNVWEWCMDWYDKNRYGQLTESGLVENKDLRYEFRVCRGGSWGSFRRDPRVSCRGGFQPADRDGALGFRPFVAGVNSTL